MAHDYRALGAPPRSVESTLSDGAPALSPVNVGAIEICLSYASFFSRTGSRRRCPAGLASCQIKTAWPDLGSEGKKITAPWIKPARFELGLTREPLNPA
jgi:hypothetical protein